MFKKITLLFTLLYACAEYASNITPWFELKPSYFFFSSYPMGKIYHKGGFEVQGSVSIPFCKHMDFYGSIGYRKASGKALNSGEKTSLKVIPVDIGLKPVFNFYERFYYFFAIGPRYFYFNQHNKSPYVTNSIKKSGIGLFANTGFNVLLGKHFLVGIFGEYSYEKKSVQPQRPNVYSNGNIQIGGFAFGANLGYAF